MADRRWDGWIGDRRWVSVIALMIAGCAARGAPPMPVHAPGLSIETESIVWSPERRLSWSDFLGRPNIASDAAAMTVYLLSYDGNCIDNVFDRRVFSAFLPDKSWVKASVLLSRADVSRYALSHEQTHFDLSELSARRMRRALAALKDPCKLDDDALNRVVDPFIREDYERQRRYDRETMYGSNTAWQRDWEMRVARELRELAEFVR